MYAQRPCSSRKDVVCFCRAAEEILCSHLLHDASDTDEARYVPVTEWLKEARWLPPLALQLRVGSEEPASSGRGAEQDPQQAPVWVQLARLHPLRQVLRLTGQLEKNARQWDAALVEDFFEAALGSRPRGRLALTSAAVEMSARRKKAFNTAVEAGGAAVSELTGKDRGTLVRDHLVPSSTPGHTPQGSSRKPASTPANAREDSGGRQLSEGSDSASEDSEVSESDEIRTPTRGHRPAVRGRKRLHST
ncbi:MAG: hypothetical protein SGPRY_005080 [Prymnesium sp.]